MTTTLLQGDCREVLKTLPEQSVQCCVTSPPYWQQRKYTESPEEIGQEPHYQQYVFALCDVFDEVWRVLRDDGTLWVNLGDAYANDTKWGGQSGGKNYTSAGGGYTGQRNKRTTGLPPKSLIGLPWRVALALQERGWVLRSAIVWHKPNAMPSPVIDRPTTDHEYMFLLAKQPRYYYNADAIREPHTTPGSEHNDPSARKGAEQIRNYGGRTDGLTRVKRPKNYFGHALGKNARTVWSICTTGLEDEHYAPYPDELPRRCILAGSRAGDTVLDPFAGSGTTLRVAESLGRNSIGIDLGYQELQERRTDGVQIRLEALL